MNDEAREQPGSPPPLSPSSVSPSSVSRRRFVQGTFGAGAGMAVIWSTPTLRSVRPLQAAGSPPPASSPVSVAGEPVATSTTTTTTTIATDPAQIDIKSGSLPVTGSEALELALVGSTAVFVGRTLMKRTNATPSTETKYEQSGYEQSGDES